MLKSRVSRMNSGDPQIPEGTFGLAVMTKAPRVGEVKTRLVPPLSPSEAAFVSSCFLRDTAAVINSVTQDEHVQGIAVYTPANTASLYTELLPSGFLLIPQRGETFGERLVFAFEDLFELGFTAVCLINSDSPTLPPQILAETIKVLRQPDERAVIVGPAADGGYYLIALRKLYRNLFDEIAWSSEHVFEQTLERAKGINLKVHILPVWYDVDDAGSLHRLCEELFRADATTRQNTVAPATRAYLEKLLNQPGRECIWPGGANR